MEEGRYDLVLGLDDLEPGNVGRADAVVQLLIQEVREHVAEMFSSRSAQAEILAKLQQTASFHLLAPMLEACFFPEPAALKRAGAVRASAYEWPAIDFEAFDVSDPAFLAPPDNTSPEVRKLTWAVKERRRHPKAYVRFLAQPDDPTGIGRKYRETREGAEALRLLDWRLALGQQDRAPLTRSMFVDLAGGLDVAFPPGVTHPATWTGKSTILRNI